MLKAQPLNNARLKLLFPFPKESSYKSLFHFLLLLESLSLSYSKEIIPLAQLKTAVLGFFSG